MIVQSFLASQLAPRGFVGNDVMRADTGSSRSWQKWECPSKYFSVAESNRIIK